MSTVKRVVVALPLERKNTTDNKVFCTRIRALGLTAYGRSFNESDASVKRMFMTYVGLHRKSGTLEDRLNKSQLQWSYESDYQGAKPFEVLLPDGTSLKIKGRTQSGETWQMKESEEEMVVAH